jgi:catechol 2,3-dioxygenase-like lactoylglutathione lyase family enzyme
VKISFVAGFGPIVTDVAESRRFWESGLGIALEEAAPSYFTNDDLDGVRAFALWPLAQAAQACFGQDSWPAELPIPQAWVEFDVQSPAAVAEAAEELRTGGHRLLTGSRLEPWGQTTSHLMSPEGLLVGVTYTPWMHGDGGEHGPGEASGE